VGQSLVTGPFLLGGKNMREKNIDSFIEDFSKEDVTCKNFDRNQAGLDDFEKLYVELKRYLKSRLTSYVGEDGDNYWDCGLDHLNPYLDWEPYQNIMAFCKERGLDDVEIINKIEEYLGRILNCECEIVNNTVVER